MKLRNIGIGLLLAACVAGAVFYAFQAGKSQSGNLLAELRDEVDSLRSQESDAAVVKRVSQQMEEIAYQQKEISDKQRDRAEEQSALALQMRDRAEQESRSARQAEQKAVLAAKETEQQRAYALAQQKIAEEQRDQATHAKNVTDSLTYRTLARTLANSAITEYENKHVEIASLLAYSSYYYLNQYNGNVYLPESFRALELCTNRHRQLYMPNRGAVTAMCATPQGCVAVSDYGEIVSYNSQKETVTTLVEQPAYNFRDVEVEGDAIYALDYSGFLYIYKPNLKGVALQLPSTNYFKILHPENSVLLLISKNSICRYNTSTGKLSKPLKLTKEITEIVKKEDVYGVFFSDKTYQEMNASAHFSSIKSPSPSHVVMAAYYDKVHWIFGCKNGDVEIKMNENSILSNSQNGKITGIAMIGSVLVTASYDKTVAIRSLSKEGVAQGITPVEFDYNAWPLSICRLGGGEILIGFSNGMLQRLNVSVKMMSAQLQSQLKRNFTMQEWNSYVGKGIPYVKFK